VTPKLAQFLTDCPSLGPGTATALLQNAEAIAARLKADKTLSEKDRQFVKGYALSLTTTAKCVGLHSGLVLSMFEGIVNHMTAKANVRRTFEALEKAGGDESA
jgi:hypothetical protein